MLSGWKRPTAISGSPAWSRLFPAAWRPFAWENRRWKTCLLPKLGTDSGRTADLQRYESFTAQQRHLSLARCRGAGLARDRAILPTAESNCRVDRHASRFLGAIWRGAFWVVSRR